MTFDNKNYMEKELKKHRNILAGLVQQAIKNNEPLDSFIIKKQEDTILAFVEAINREV